MLFEVGLKGERLDTKRIANKPGSRRSECFGVYQTEVTDGIDEPTRPQRSCGRQELAPARQQRHTREREPRRVVCASQLRQALDLEITEFHFGSGRIYRMRRLQTDGARS